MSTPICTKVSLECPVELTIYGYAPNYAGNTFFVVFFALCCVAQIAIGIRTRFPAFTIVAAICCLLEALGYGGRLMLYQNPWSVNGFKLQLVCLILAPSFLAAGLYLTVQYLVHYHGRKHSRIKAGLYPAIFVSCDLVSIIVQAIGGGMAASGIEDLFDTGNTLMMAGIAIQVATMFFCLVLAADTAFSVGRSPQPHEAEGVSTNRMVFNGGYICYLLATSFAFLAVFARCVYRSVRSISDASCQE